MKICIVLSSLALVGMLSISAQDIRDKVKDGGADRVTKTLIDPDSSIFGFAIGVSEDEMTKALGKPDGYLRLRFTRTGQ